MRDEYVEAVRSVVALIPAGRVLSYGDIAEILHAGGPRQVGAVLSSSGTGLPWWRVIRAGGEPPRCHEKRALEHYRSEGTPLSGKPDADGGGYRVRIGPARWFPTEGDWSVIESVRAELVRQETGMSAGRDEVEA